MTKQKEYNLEPWNQLKVRYSHETSPETNAWLEMFAGEVDKLVEGIG